MSAVFIEFSQKREAEREHDGEDAADQIEAIPVIEERGQSA